MSIKAFIKSLFKPATSGYTKQVYPGAPCIFIPVYDFYSDEFQSDYIAGLQYRVKTGNYKLNHYVNKWVNEGRVKIVPEDGRARLTGNGKV